MSIFLDEADLVRLTGFKAPSRQIEQLRRVGVPFRVNGMGKPVVAVAAIEGKASATAAPKREKVVPLLYRTG